MKKRTRGGKGLYRPSIQTVSARFSLYIGVLSHSPVSVELYARETGKFLAADFPTAVRFSCAAHGNLQHEPRLSGRWDSNPRHTAYKAAAHPTELLPDTRRG